MRTISITAILTIAILGSAPAQARITNLAPADHYFGHFNLSVLGVRNAIKDLDIREDLHLADDEATIYGKLLIVEDAVRDWRTKYPNDSWLPPFGVALAKVWFKLNYSDAKIRAASALDWVILNYPNSEAAAWATSLRAEGRARPSAVPVVPIEER